MAIEKINIEYFLELSKQHPVIDVRSPGEFKHAHIPGAYSLPLFTDEERAVVGTAYKQESREKAIKHGLDFFGTKMKNMVEEVEGILDLRRTMTERNLNQYGMQNRKPKTVLLYCWRGGMRSGALGWLFDMYGFKVYTLIGGYKKFRNYVLETLKLPFDLKILGGYTGSGKTEVIKELRRKGELVIDLEDIAKHKGSAFGNIGMPRQPTQEMFENILSIELRTLRYEPKTGGQNSNPQLIIKHSPIWLEDESQRIGLINLPNDLWQTIRQSEIYFLNIPFEERLKHLVEEYGTLDKEKMVDAIIRIKERLGGLEAKRAIEFLEQDNPIESFRILLKYYDKWYAKGLHNRENINSLLHTIICDSVTPENAKKLIQQPVYHEKP
ncbi:MAG TPA: tRNA 2-selenouridine(34) synthase MnmH [Chitinophagaceae bacterium]|nr:tRNA 2-selenouridine(34) synthase MnmH [Chitinophagaceae bacterium]